MKILLTPKLFITTLSIAIIYILITIYSMNAQLVKETILGNFSVSYKVNLILALASGMWTVMSGWSLLLLVVTAILTGVNIILLAQRIAVLKNTGNLHFVVGGSTLLGVAGSGCAACGLPILALLGLSGSVVYLPFRGMELSIIAVILLFVSLYFMIKTNRQGVCDVNLRVSKA